MKRNLRTGLIILLLSLSLISCGKNDDKSETSRQESTYELTSTIETEDMAFANEDASLKVGDAKGLESNSTSNLTNQINNMNEKLIRKVYLDVETKEFDKFISTITSKINVLGGYIESLSTDGNSMNNTKISRYSSMIVRIPSQKLNQFIGVVENDGTVTSKEETTENVTLEYVDIESHKKALMIEQDRLFAILKKADNLDDIIKLESRLSEIRYQLQEYESTLRYYDNLVDYSTVSLNIQEVERITLVKDETDIERMKNGLSESISSLIKGIKNLIISFVINLPYFILWGIVIVVILVIYKKTKKHIGKKETKQNAKDQINENSDESRSKEELENKK